MTNYQKAKQELTDVINNQKTIRVSRLEKLLRDSYMHQLDELLKVNKGLRKKVKRQKDRLAKLEKH